MTRATYKASTGEARRPRKEAGQFVQRLRLKAGLSQLELAKALGYEYYTFVSQVESGAARVPAESLVAWAKALNVDVKPFARTLLRHYDPHTYRALFQDGSRDGRATGVGARGRARGRKPARNALRPATPGP
jgi:transcriptional regulator with XRE-family HTH domain